MPTGLIRRSNCIVFAMLLYRRRKRKGMEGYLVLRVSRFAWVPHCLYGEIRRDGQLRVVSYVPRNPKHKAVPPPIFSGTSRWGDLDMDRRHIGDRRSRNRRHGRHMHGEDFTRDESGRAPL